MNYLDEALATHGPNRSQERREKTAGGTSINIIPCQGKKGFCETCQRHKPAPSKRVKGWECDDCVNPNRGNVCVSISAGSDSTVGVRGLCLISNSTKLGTRQTIPESGKSGSNAVPGSADAAE